MKKTTSTRGKRFTHIGHWHAILCSLNLVAGVVLGLAYTGTSIRFDFALDRWAGAVNHSLHFQPHSGMGGYIVLAVASISSLFQYKMSLEQGRDSNTR